MPTAIPVKSRRRATIVSQEQFLTFITMERTFAIAAAYVEGIVEIEGLVRIPMLSPFLLSMIGSDNSLLPIIDFLERFGCAPIGAKEATRVLVIAVDGIRIGLVTDHVDEVLKPLRQLDMTKLGCGLRREFITHLCEGDAGTVIALEVRQITRAYLREVQGLEQWRFSRQKETA